MSDPDFDPKVYEELARLFHEHGVPGYEDDKDTTAIVHALRIAAEEAGKGCLAHTKRTPVNFGDLIDCGECHRCKLRKGPND